MTATTKTTMAEAEDESMKDGKANEIHNKESEIVAEFCSLLEQSRQFFKNLRWNNSYLWVDVGLYDVDRRA